MAMVREDIAMKKKILYTLIIIAFVIAVFSSFVIIANAETITPQMNISYCNISFRDNVCIKYAVNSTVSEVRILIWTSPKAEYTFGTHDSEIAKYYTEDIDGVSCMIFDYTDLSAKQMTDVVYARAYANVDGVDYYSSINKYSILQYAYNKLGKTATASTDAELKDMLSNMLLYGASAQKYFDYKENRLATSEWYQVKLTEGFLDDGCTHGMYCIGDVVTLTAPETDPIGHVFSHWADGNGNEVATTTMYELTVGNANDVYTPLYGHNVVIDAAVAPTCNETGLTEGSHCSVCGEVIVAQRTIEPTGEHSFSDCTTVKEATTSEEGLMERVCGCGEKETQTIEKLVQELTYTLNSDKQSYSVTGIGTWIDSDLVIPAAYNGLPVTNIADSAFKGNKTLTSVIIPEGVKSIGNEALYGCTNVSSITIPESVTSIGWYAFWYCRNLVSVTIPNGVTEIPNSTFQGCTSLSNITIPESVTWIGNRAFYNCENLAEITLPNNITDIDSDAFLNTAYYNDTSNWEHDVLYIGNYLIAAEYIYGDYEIKSETKCIADFAFLGCSSLTSITIPNSVTKIGEGTFSNCVGLANVILHHNITSIDSYAFRNCTSLTSITMPYNITSIGNGVFEGCSNLSTVYSLRPSWGNVSLGDSNDNLIATICFYSETKPTNTYYNYWHYVDDVRTRW